MLDSGFSGYVIYSDPALAPILILGGTIDSLPYLLSQSNLAALIAVNREDILLRECKAKNISQCAISGFPDERTICCKVRIDSLALDEEWILTNSHDLFLAYPVMFCLNDTIFTDTLSLAYRVRTPGLINIENIHFNK